MKRNKHIGNKYYAAMGIGLPLDAYTAQPFENES